jgi:hypothetical protein
VRQKKKFASLNKSTFFHKGSMTKDVDVLFFVRFSIKKIRQSAALPALESSEELTADF